MDAVDPVTRFAEAAGAFCAWCGSEPGDPLYEALTGDLADDIADIHRDVGDGLSIWRAGHADAAEWQWAFSYRFHWGRHATEAIHALYCWLSDERGW